MSRSGPLGAYRGSTRVQKYLRRGFSLQEARNEARKEAMRVYSQKRRRDPAFRVKENRSTHLSKKLRDALPYVPNLRERQADCEFCGVRRAVTKVDRLVLVAGEFVSKKLRYCGKC